MSILKPYTDGLANRQLLVPFCTACAKPHFYPRHACPSCWGEAYDWRPAVGSGHVHTQTTVMANPPSSFVALLPYSIAIVELAEGVRLLTNIVGERPPVVGDPVALEFIERDGRVLPVFRVVAS